MSLSEEFTKTLYQKFKTNNEKINLIIDATLIKLLKKISGVEMYQEICDSTLHGLSVANPSDLDKIFERLEIKPIVYWNPINNQQKQYIIVSNHPTGPLEGIFIQKIFNTLGLRGKTMGDDIMSGVEQMKDAYIGLSIRVGGKSRITQLRNIKKELLNGLSLALFPAASVSHFDLKEMKISDYPWESGFIEMAKSNNLDIIPVYIDANLSILHYIFKEVYEDISSLRLFRESKIFIDKNKGKTLELYIGQPISSKELESNSECAKKVQEICENLMFQSYTNIESK